jgi:excinuclease ABC subunit A
VTEIHDYLRLLYARVGTPYCPDHPTNPLAAQSVSQMVDAVLAMPADTKLMILAPVVANRKGEHSDLFDAMQAQGFVRFRIQSGTGVAKIYEADSLPTLKKTEKHTIDVVIDRVKVSEEIKQRLAESFETSLRIAEGRAIALQMDSGHEQVFSNKFACPECGYSLQELEPRLFSFNNPMGACPECDGLGHIEFFDPKRIVAFPNLSLASGAVKGWDRRNQFYFQMLSSLAAFYHFDVTCRLRSLMRPHKTLCCMAQVAKKFLLPTLTSAAAPPCVNIPSRVWCRICSVVIVKPIRWRLKKNWPNSSMKKNVHPATAHACA